MNSRDNVINEQTTPTFSFGVPLNRTHPGNNTLTAYLHCANENWSQASSKSISFYVQPPQNPQSPPTVTPVPVDSPINAPTLSPISQPDFAPTPFPSVVPTNIGGQNPPPQGTPVFNALNTPLSMNSNGDLVYDIALGVGSQPTVGQYVYVRPDYHSLFFRSTPDSSGRSNIIATLNAGDYYVVIQVSGGWAQIQTQNAGIGWVSTAYAQLGGQVQIIPTNTPGYPAKYPDAQSGKDGINVDRYCKDIGYDVEQHSNADAYSFRCVKDQTVYHMDLAAWNRACSDVWGSARPNATLSNSTELGAWKCEPSPGSVDPYRAPVQPTVAQPPTNAPQPNPPSNPNPQPNNPPSDGDPCGYAMNDISRSPFVEYVPSLRMDKKFDIMQCVDFVRHVAYPKLWDDCKISGNAGTWADWVRNHSCDGLIISPAQHGGTVNPSIDIHYGDIAVWTPRDPKSKCGVIPWPGHVAVVVDASQAANNVLTIAESNVPNTSGQPQVDVRRDLDYSCMSFIHVPWAYTGIGSNPNAGSNNSGNGGSQGVQPGQPVASGNVQATNITWSFCMFCTSHAWVKFQVPKGKYDLANAKVTYGGATVAYDNLSITSDGTMDTITFHIAASIIQDLKDSGGDLNDLSRWHLFYTILK